MTDDINFRLSINCSNSEQLTASAYVAEKSAEHPGVDVEYGSTYPPSRQAIRPCSTTVLFPMYVSKGGRRVTTQTKDGCASCVRISHAKPAAQRRVLYL